MNCDLVEPPGTYPLNFLVKGIEPPAKEWRGVSEAEKIRFYTIAGVIAEKVKQDELQRGLDRHGRKLRAVKWRKVRFRRSGRVVDGEPLMPHRGLSRTRRLLTYTVTAQGVLFYWQNGWGKILDMHRRGACITRDGRVVGKLPVRDVFGISPDGIAKIKEEAYRAWKERTTPEKMIHPGMSPQGGISIELPFDNSQIKPPKMARPKPKAAPEPAKMVAKPVEKWDVTDFLAIGVQVQRNTATSRIRNTATGTPGLKDTGLVITKQFGKFKFAK